MRIFHDPSELSQYLKEAKSVGKKIGFVPTMGALHEGHLALISASKRENDLTVCSIFVNPTQFNNKEDLALYPRPIDSDRQKLEDAGCDVLFSPSEVQMYRQLPRLKFDFGHLETIMEGKFRPGHFNGVGIVVAKLFHIVQPDYAYFGQKDYQQYLVISTLVSDLSFQLTLVCHPTVRESDGLALSSRNLRLTEKEREKAPLIFKALEYASQLLKTGKDIQDIKTSVQEMIHPSTGFELEYVEVANATNLELLDGQVKNQRVVICLAAFLGKVRLIDNVLVDL
ncbi:MAG: pantoate--beta-alanine ligase [Cytophagales bacterium]|nr:pantoate--beta-alanine ligase [Cytophagales bacterium]